MGREAKANLWRKRVESFERSGLCRRVWCARARVAVSTLDVWRRRLRNIAGTTLIPIVVAPPTGRAVAAASIEVEADCLRVQIPAGTDPAWVWRGAARAAARITPRAWWVATAPIDLCCGIDRLLVLAQTALGHDDFDGSAYLFRNRSGTRLKVLCVDGQGVWLYMRCASLARHYTQRIHHRPAPLGAQVHHLVQQRHHHKGLNGSTPHEAYSGDHVALSQARQQTRDAVYAKHPECCGATKTDQQAAVLRVEN